MKLGEVKSCIQTFELLCRLAFRTPREIDLSDAQNCDKIAKILKSQLSREDTTHDCVSRSESLEIVRKHCETNSMQFVKIQKEMNDLPPVQPGVIICENCNLVQHHETFLWCIEHEHIVERNGFCSWAEKESNG